MDRIYYQFNTVQDAAKALLIEVTSALNQLQITYLVIGGWVPYLRNSTSYPHPGTKDIDILFSDGAIKNGLHDVIKYLLERDYKVSAKHDFQMLKEVMVSGRSLVFNIDLLHPSESVNNPEMLVDHFDLGISENDLEENKMMRSIVLPSSALLFKEDFWNKQSFKGIGLDGKRTELEFPLLGLAGLVLSKSESIASNKRPRDSFDVFLAFESDKEDVIPHALNKHIHINGVR